MTWAPFILLAVGLLMIYLEFFLPGGIMGIAGSILVVASIIVFGIQAPAGWLVLLYLLAVAAIVGGMVWWALRRIRSGKAKGIFLSTIQEGHVASSYNKELVGKTGEALSDLKPAGHILVENKRYQAVSKTGYLVKGTEIKVIGGEGAHLIVKKEEANDSNAS